MIKKYKQFNESLVFQNTEEEIHDLCSMYKIVNYTINEDMSIDVEDRVGFYSKNLYKLPLKFNVVSGGFFISNVGLYTLEGCPKRVGRNFDCTDNNLKSLEGMPHFVGGHIFCQLNKIKSFKGVPEYFEGSFICVGNPIFEIYKLFNTDSECIYWINEYDVIQGDNIIMDRLEEVFHQLNMEVPIIKEIEGYNLI